MPFSFARSSSPAGAGAVTSTVWSASADAGGKFCTGSLADQLHGGDVRRQGGGEGRAPVGRPGPVTPWGKPAMGYKTRKGKNPTNKFIVKRRNAK